MNTVAWKTRRHHSIRLFPEVLDRFRRRWRNFRLRLFNRSLSGLPGLFGSDIFCNFPCAFGPFGGFTMNWPFKHINLKNLGGKIAYAQFLHDGSEVKITNEDKSMPHGNMSITTPAGGATLLIPVVKPDVEVPVIELILNGN